MKAMKSVRKIFSPTTVQCHVCVTADQNRCEGRRYNVRIGFFLTARNIKEKHWFETLIIEKLLGVLVIEAIPECNTS